MQPQLARERRQPGEQVGHRDADLLRSAAGPVVAFAGDAHQPAHALRDLIEPGAHAIGPVLPEAADAHHHQAGERLRERVRGEAVSAGYFELFGVRMQAGRTFSADEHTGRGDRVLIYMPMIAEAAFAMLACARIGAIHSVVFAGFSAVSSVPSLA